jgi:uncharacterized membrane protein (DUF2068 family)
MAARRARLLPWIAAERAIRGLLLVGVGIYLLSQPSANLGSLAARLARRVELDPDHGFVHHLIVRVGALDRNQITLIGAGAIAYGLLELVEGVGLWLDQLWAEYLTVIATSLLIPLEVYELVRKPSLLKAGGIVVNLAIVGYLAWNLRRRVRADRARDARTAESG